MIHSKADTHIHTTCSDGLMDPEETVDYVASQTDIRVIAITDHDTTEGSFLARDYAKRHGLALDVVIAQEVTTDEGDVVGLFLNKTLPTFPTAVEAIEAIHTQGGLAVAVHPCSYWATLGQMKGVGRNLCHLPLDAIEACNGFPTNVISNPLTSWINRRRGQNLPEMGGSDSHVPFTVGQAFTWFPGQTAGDLRQAIEAGTVRVGGSLWKATSLMKLLPVLRRKGLPSQQSKPVPKGYSVAHSRK